MAAKSGWRLGITVKSRTRQKKKSESESVNVFSRKHGDRKKLKKACKAFGFTPWLGIYVECGKAADLYLTSLKNYDNKYKSMKAHAIEGWSMSNRRKNQYDQDPNVFHINFVLGEKNWPPVK